MHDLKINELGDIEENYLNQLDSITKALIRRIATTQDGYSRLIKTSDGYKELDTNYGSSLYSYLSLPTSELEDDYILSVLRQAASIDSRIEILDVSKVFTSGNTLSLSIRYNIVDTSTLGTLIVNV